jgi:hypothetical protein
VHLPVFAEVFPVGIENRGGVVIQTFGALLEQRCNDDDTKLLGEGAERGGTRPRNRLGELEEAVVLDLAEVPAQEQLGAGR